MPVDFVAGQFSSFLSVCTRPYILVVGYGLQAYTQGRRSMGQGGHVPPIFGLGDIITNVPLNISRVISATFYPCNIFLISWKSF